jgi:hypothetical protein
MNWHSGKLLGILTLIVLVLGVLPIAVAQSPASQDKIEAALLDRLARDGTADMIVRFAEQADLSPAYSMNWNDRGWFVYNSLRETAAHSQTRAIAYVKGRGLDNQTFIAGDELYIEAGDLQAANALAAMPEVASVRAARTYYLDPILAAAPAAPNALAWGITDTKADQFWTTYGRQGDGIVVANIDTGVQWNHPALDQAYRCPGNPTDPSCWYDPGNYCVGTVCDNNGHGTHTMGTMVGDDDPTLSYQVGMAPNAQWIACKGCGSDSCSDADLNACADWILAPGGSPSNRPNVVNNSWGGGGGDNWYQAKVTAWRAAGVFPAFSAGNSGSNCNTLGSPGDYQESFATAAHDSSRAIAWFSSRGPSAFGHDPYTKPNISAPGVDICSTVPTNSWSCGYSGTSMASPHTAGAVALLWSCDPSLVGQVDQTFQILQNTADVPPAGSCGAPPDGQGNYTFGYGYLDIYSAGLTWCTSSVGVLTGQVTHAYYGTPIAGASVTAVAGRNASIQAVTDPTGHYTLTLPLGSYTVTAQKTGYTTAVVPGVVVVAGTTVLDLQLDSPVAVVTPPSLHAYVTPAISATLALHIANPGGLGLEYTILETTATLRLAAKVYPPLVANVSDVADANPNVVTGRPAELNSIDTWGTGTAMPGAGRYRMASTSDDCNRVWSLGGGAGGTGSSDVMSYDSSADTWNTSLTLIPNAGQNWQAAAIAGKIYLAGGYDGVHNNWLQIYDIASNTWSAGANMSTAHTPMAAAWNGRLYVFGGNPGPLADVSMYDPATSTWTDGLAPLPVARAYGRAITAGDSIYVVGGSLAGAITTGAFDRYDPATNTWTSGPDMPTARADASVFAVGDYLYASGGIADFSMWAGITNIERYYLPSFPGGSWEVMAAAPDGFGAAAYGCAGNKMWSIGGDDASSTSVTTNRWQDEGLPCKCGDGPIDVPWVSEAPVSGTVPAGTNLDVDVVFTAVPPYNVVGQSYTATLVLSHNDPVYPDDILVPIIMTVASCLPVQDASFTWTPRFPAPGDTVTFTGTASSAAPITYTWNLGDGNLGAGQTLTHTYPLSGTYAVIMTATNGCGTGAVLSHAIGVGQQLVYLPLIFRNSH